MTVRVTLALAFAAALAFGMSADGLIPVVTWKARTGADRLWSSPGLDDSGWDAAVIGEPAAGGVRWYRARVTVPSEWAATGLAVALPPIEEAYEVFIDGVRVGGVGRVENYPVSRFERHAAFDVPREASRKGDFLVAIRRWTGRGRTNFAALTTASRSLAPGYGTWVGPANLVFLRQRLLALEDSRSLAPKHLISALLLVVSLLAFLLYRERRDRQEYLWLGLAMLLVGLAPLAAALATALDVPKRSWFPSLIGTGYALGGACSALFLRYLCPRARWLLMADASLEAFRGCYIGLSLWGDLPYFDTLSACIAAISLLAQGFAAVQLARDEHKHGLALSLSVLSYPVVRLWRALSGSVWGQWGGYFFDFRDVVFAFFAVTALTVLYLRFREEQRQQQAREQELSAARRAQQLLLSGSAGDAPGYLAEQAYLPAREVGGDLYHLSPRSGGGLLVLIGDVSGKGLEAAMRGAILLGALRTAGERAPAKSWACSTKPSAGIPAEGS